MQQISDPIREASSFNKGDFVKYLDKTNGATYAGLVVSHFSLGRKDPHPAIHVMEFYEGFPRTVSMKPRYRDIEKINREEILEHLRAIDKGFNNQIQGGGLAGAVVARRQYHLNHIVNLFANQHEGVLVRESEMNRYGCSIEDSSPPETGVYVVLGVFADHGSSDEYKEGLTIKPRISERDVSAVLHAFSPHGFGNIPNQVEGLEPRLEGALLSFGKDGSEVPKGTLVGYKCFEIPQSAIHLVEEPRTLEWKLR